MIIPAYFKPGTYIVLFHERGYVNLYIKVFYEDIYYCFIQCKTKQDQIIEDLSGLVMLDQTEIDTLSKSLTFPNYKICKTGIGAIVHRFGETWYGFRLCDKS